jgi:hypothetical protein
MRRRALVALLAGVLALMAFAGTASADGAYVWNYGTCVAHGLIEPSAHDLGPWTQVADPQGGTHISTPYAAAFPHIAGNCGV